MSPKRKKGMKSKGGLRKKAKIIKNDELNDDVVVKEEPESPPLKKKSTTKQKKKIVLSQLTYRKAAISCSECNKKFRFKKSFANHQLQEHSKVPGSVKCDKCPVRCPNKAILKKHVADFHEREIFECPHCKKKFVRHAHVLRHMAQKGCDGNETQLYPCEICNAQFSRKDNLMVHLRLQHILRKQFGCKQCPYSTCTFTKLIIHVQKQHSDQPQQYECDHCGKVTSSRAAICKHLEIHGEKKYSCDVCGYSTYTIEVMRRHVLTHVMEKPFKCPQCDHSFIQRVQLLRHMERHRGSTCRICDKTFFDKADLLVHSKTHLNASEDKLVCPIVGCGEKFHNEGVLLKHVKQHMTERPFTCEVCSKRFRNENDMRRHVQSHTLERPRRCMYCVAARAYVRGEQLVRHVRKMHPPIFRDHLEHVRKVIGTTTLSVQRVKKSELESILNVLDAEAERILLGYGEGVLYGGMQEADADGEMPPTTAFKSDNSSLMSEEELSENLNKLLVQLIDKELLECFGWPDESVDVVLEKVIEHCGAKPADREKWTRVQRLRENSKQLFLYVIEDKNIARMLDSHTIDQIIKHILAQVSETENEEEENGLEEATQEITSI